MHMKKSLVSLAALPLVLAQTSTDCNPTEKTCPSDVGLDATTFSTDFITGNASWTAEEGTTITYTDKGAEFIIDVEGQAPTIETDFYFFFGTVEVKMQAANGTGIVSSIVLESDDLDEIDWEFLGGDTTQVETNYFGKGNTTTYNRAIYYPVTTPQDEMHTYTVDWTKSQLTFAIDGTVVRTLLYDDALEGKNYPQTPMRLKLGIWAGGASTEAAGTIEWAGGETDFSDAPFTMIVESVKITNNNPACSYTYGDETGDYSSIELNKNCTSSDSTSTSTSAPTSSLVVSAVSNTNVAVSKTASVASGSATAAATGYGGLSSNITSSNLTSSTNASAASSSSASASASSVAASSDASLTSVASLVGSFVAMAIGFWML